MPDDATHPVKAVKIVEKSEAQDNRSTFPHNFTERLKLLVSGKHSERSIKELLEKAKLVEQYNPTASAEEFLSYALSLNDVAEDRCAFISRLLGGEQVHGFDQDFPRTSSLADLQDKWDVFRLRLLDHVGPGHTTPSPKRGSCAYLWTRCLRQVANGSIADRELGDDLKSLQDCLDSPHAQQAFLSALFCRWVFQSPEPMLEGYYPPSTMKHLELAMMIGTFWVESLRTPIADSEIGGLQQVVIADKVVAQELFHCPDEQSRTVQPREQALVKDLAKIAKSMRRTHKTPFSILPNKMAAEALKYKVALMLSPEDYRIHYCPAGSHFDPAWMQACNDRNEPVGTSKAAGKPVALCLFPALFAQDAKPFTHGSNIVDVLVKNKTFFPENYERESLDPKQCVAKATVLVL